MLPLAAEFRRTRAYRITDAGHLALHQAGMAGSSAGSRKEPGEQMLEFRVLDYLAERESAREPVLKSATHADTKILAGLVRKKWITREDLSSVGEACRTVKVAVLKAAATSCSETSGQPFNSSPPRELGSGSLRMTEGMLPPSPQREKAFCPGREPRVGDEKLDPSLVAATHKTKLNANQQEILDTLKTIGGRMRVDTLRELPSPTPRCKLWSNVAWLKS